MVDWDLGDGWEDPNEAELDDDNDYGDPCSRCGPWCESWGGDGLCDLEIQAMVDQEREYAQNFTKPAQTCPACGKEGLQLFQVPVDEMWTWPGDFYSPMIALDIYGAYDHPDKGELHHQGNIYHIVVGGQEKLIELTGNEKPQEALFNVDEEIPF